MTGLAEQRALSRTQEEKQTLRSVEEGAGHPGRL